MVKTKFIGLGVLSLFLLLYGCSTTGPTVVKERETGVVVSQKSGITGSEKTIRILKCSAPTSIKVTVADVKCSAAGCQKKGADVGGGLMAILQLAGTPSFEGIGAGLKDMYLSSLREVGCFKVLDREALETIQKEMALSGKTLKAESADYVVMGSVTSINFERKSGSLGGGLVPVIGAISSTKQKATLGMDIRLVNVETGEIVFSKTYNAESGKTSYGFGGFGVGGGVGFGGRLSGLSGTAMEEVARDIIVKSTYDIATFLAPEQIRTTTKTIAP